MNESTLICILRNEMSKTVSNRKFQIKIHKQGKLWITTSRIYLLIPIRVAPAMQNVQKCQCPVGKNSSKDRSLQQCAHFTPGCK